VWILRYCHIAAAEAECAIDREQWMNVVGAAPTSSPPHAGDF